MSSRILARAGFAPAALLVVALVSPAIAEKPSAPPCPRPAKVVMVRATYQVADLVIPVDREPRRIVVGCNKAEKVAPEKSSAAPAATREDLLIKLITNTVAPKSWSEMGGPGTIEYFPLTMALLINQTPEVQDQIADLLAALRRLQDQEVSVEVRIVTMKDESPCEQGRDLKVLDDSQLARMMEAVQGDRPTNVMQAPKLTVFSGQRATMCIGDEQSFLTGVDVRVQEGTLTVVPKPETYSSGIELSVQPVISADRRSVRVDLQALITDVDSSAPLLPVTLPSMATDGSGDEKPVAFTQFIQQPRVRKLNIDKSFTVPDGGTMLVAGGTRIREGRNEYSVPILSDIPYLSRLFRNVGYTRETERVLVLVTPRIIAGREEEEKAKPAAPPAAKNPVPELMKQFNAAYKEGKYEEAEKWALMAQELDPDNEVCSAALYTARRQQAAHAEQPITPCAAAEPAVSPCPAKKGGPKKVAALLAKYHEACAAGRLDEAHKLARKALAIDPACFDNPRR
jgi:type II secretory pathway component GspD/PulD (secretin)